MASWPLVRKARSSRQAHGRRRRPITDVGGRDPLPGADQRVPGAFPRIGQVHGVDAVGHLAHAAQVLPFHAGGRLPALTWPVSSTAPTARPRRRPVLRRPHPARPRRTGAPPPSPRTVSHTARFSSRCVRSGVRSPATLGDRPPVPSAQVAHHRGGVLARLQPRLGPRETRPQQFQQLSAFPAPQRGAYPGGSSRLRFCCPHKRMIDRRLPLGQGRQRRLAAPAWRSGAGQPQASWNRSAGLLA